MHINHRRGYTEVDQIGVVQEQTDGTEGCKRGFHLATLARRNDDAVGGGDAA